MIVPLAWLAHLAACFYVVRPLRSSLHRALLAMVPCVILLAVGCHRLPAMQMTSVMVVSLQWMAAIRLFHLAVLAPSDTQSFNGYVRKFLWCLFPVVPCQSHTPVYVALLTAACKLLVNQWAYRWLRMCEPNDSYGRLAIFYAFICSGTLMFDLQAIVVRLVTRNKYSVIEFNNSPFLSKSLREFWGRRYNRLVSTLLKQSIFEPVRRLPHCSANTAAVASFVASGLLHGHVAVAAMGASSPLPSFMFFVLHGLACCVETICPFAVPKPIGIILTHAFLLATAPLYAGLFTRAGPVYYETSEPPLLEATWFPKLPLPNFCPK